MSEAQEYRRTSIRDLIETMRRYMDDNQNSRDVNERWFADYLIPVWKAATEVGNGRMDDARKIPVQEFRARELEKEIESKRRETDALERELKKTRAA